MGSTFWTGMKDTITSPFGTANRSGWGTHPSVLWERQGGPVLPSSPYSGVAPSLAGAQAGYSPQSYVKAAGGYLDPNNKPTFNTGGY